MFSKENRTSIGHYIDLLAILGLEAAPDLKNAINSLPYDLLGTEPSYYIPTIIGVVHEGIRTWSQEKLTTLKGNATIAAMTLESIVARAARNYLPFYGDTHQFSGLIGNLWDASVSEVKKIESIYAPLFAFFLTEGDRLLNLVSRGSERLYNWVTYKT